MCSMRCDESLKYHPVLQRKWSGGESTSVSTGLVVCKLALSVLTSSMISLVLSKTNKTIYMLELTS